MSVKIWKRASGCFLVCAALLSPAMAADTCTSEKLAKFFNGYSGTFVMRDTAGKPVLEYNDALAKQSLSPCSTFKIVIALIGLETGVIKDENTSEKWNGEGQKVEEWNKDHNLQSAMRESVNWYFQRVCAKVGQAELSKYLKVLHYGNEDLSSGIDNFWMGETGSLRITPSEQVDFLERLYADKLPLSVRSQQIVKRVLRYDETANGVLFGKTGTDSKDGQLVAGWFVGFVEGKKGNYVFATHVEGKSGVTGSKAREISKKILAELGDW